MATNSLNASNKTLVNNTSNITENISINLTANLSIKNLTIPENTSITNNISINLSLNFTKNLTLNNSPGPLLQTSDLLLQTPKWVTHSFNCQECCGTSIPANSLINIALNYEFIPNLSIIEEFSYNWSPVGNRSIENTSKGYKITWDTVPELGNLWFLLISPNTTSSFTFKTTRNNESVFTEVSVYSLLNTTKINTSQLTNVTTNLTIINVTTNITTINLMINETTINSTAVNITIEPLTTSLQITSPEDFYSTKSQSMIINVSHSQINEIILVLNNEEISKVPGVSYTIFSLTSLDPGVYEYFIHDNNNSITETRYFKIEESDIFVYKEQSNGTLPNQENTVTIILYSEENVKNVTVYENYPTGWIITSDEQDNGSAIIFNTNLTGDISKVLTYTIASPANEGTGIFLTKVESKIINKTTKVESTRSYFETTLDLYAYDATLNRTITNNTEYEASIKVKNIGPDIISKRIYYSWEFDNTKFNVYDAKGCSVNAKTINCTWLNFLSNETKVINFKINSSIEGTSNSHSLTTYDPLAPSQAYSGMFKTFFSTIWDSITWAFSKIAEFFTMNSPTGKVVSDIPKGQGKKETTTTIEETTSSTIISSSTTTTSIQETTTTSITNFVSGGGGGRKTTTTTSIFDKASASAIIHPATVSPGENTTFNITIINPLNQKITDVKVSPNISFSNLSCMLVGQIGNNYCDLGEIKKSSYKIAPFTFDTSINSLPGIYNISSKVMYEDPNKSPVELLTDSSLTVGDTIYYSEQSHFLSVSSKVIAPTLKDPLIEILDSNGKKTDTKIKIKKDGVYVEVTSLTQISECTDCEFELTPLGKHISKIELRGVVLKNKTLSLKVDDVPTAKADVQNKKVLKSFAIDPTSLNFTNGSISSTATGSELFKCADWNFSTQTCYGDWVKLMDLIPGEEYSVVISPLDPGFAETGVASINTKKPMYHPNETAEIIIVVLDTYGHLVSGAEVDLTITDPNSQEYYFSTEITETSKGIYEVEFNSTSITGEYPLLVEAIGLNVNGSMSSSFAVAESFAFDIIRDTPVTLDPWAGIHSSSIKLVAFDYSGTFNYTEVLPENFTLGNVSGAIVTYGNTINLSWTGLTNNSIVSYTFNPPLITPELYEMGPSFVSFNSQIFEEARPWYLAVDPSDSGSLILFWDDAVTDVPNSDWECISCGSGDFYNLFPRGAESYGGTSGTKTHSHTLTYFSDSGPDSTTDYRSSGANTDFPSATHTHTSLGSQTVGPGSLMPEFRSLKIIRYKYGVPSIIPSGVIAIFNTTPTGDWAAYSDQDSKFVLGNGSIVTGGSADHTHSVDITTTGPVGTPARARSGSNAAVTMTHTHSGIGTSGTGDQAPPYVEVIFAKASSDTAIPDGTAGFIGMFNYTPPAGWTSVSGVGGDFNGNFIVGNSASYGSTGGSATHNHTALSVAVGASGTTNYLEQRSGNTGAGTGHGHTITVAFDEVSNLPPYRDVIFSYARDFSGPSIQMNYPQDNNFSLTTVNFNITPSDDTGIANCTIILNGTVNKTSTVITNNEANIITENIGEGHWLWTVNCTDTLGYESTNGTEWDLTVDLTGPTVTQTPLNPDGGITNNPDVVFYFNASDWSDIDECTLYFSSIPINTSYSISKTETNNFTQLDLGDGPYYWEVKCTDQLGNEGASGERTYTVDSTKPKVALLEPINNAYYNSSTLIFFNYTPKDDYLDACWLEGNFSSAWGLNDTENSPDNLLVNIFGPKTIAEGSYVWNVDCNDTAGNVGHNNTNFTLTIDLTDPQVNFAANNPVNNYNTSSPNIILNFSHTESYPDTLIGYFSGSPYTRSYAGSWTNISISGIEDGAHSYYAWINDSSSRVAQTTSRTVTIDTAGPDINLTDSEDNTWTNIAATDFNFTANDGLLPITSCELILNGTVNETKAFSDKPITSYLNTTLTEGLWNWSVNCTDLVGNENTSNYWLIKVDLTNPAITDEQVNETSHGINDKICLEVNASDLFSGVRNVTVTVDWPDSGPVNESLSNDSGICGNSGGEIYAIILTLSESGDYNWTKTYANDTASNLRIHTPISEIIWTAISTNTLNATITNPLVNFEINESEYNYEFDSNCTLNCTEGTCTSAISRVQYRGVGDWTDITPDSSLFTTTVYNISCGDLAGPSEYCKTNFSVASTESTGGDTYEFRCIGASITTSNAYSDEVNITVNNHPDANIYYPAVAEWLKGTITLNGSTSTDDQGFSIYAFYLDDNSDFTTASEICNSSSDTCGFNTISQGECAEEDSTCYIKLVVKDNDGLKNSTFIQIGIDNTAPSLSITSPNNSTNISTTTYDVNASSSDSGSGMDTVKFQYKNHTQNTWTDICTDTDSGYGCAWDLSSLDNIKFYELRVVANDTIGNNVTKINKNFTLDFTSPALVLDSPANNDYVNENFTLSYNVSDNLVGVKNCTIYFGLQANQTNSTISEVSTNYFYFYNVSEDDYLWYVSCIDYFGNSNTTGMRTVRVENSGPSTLIDLPVPSANISASTFVVNASATDLGAGVDNVEFYYKENEFDSWHLLCSNSTQPYSCTWNTGAMGEGNDYQIQARANDTLNNFGAYDTHSNITIDRTPPELSLNLPANDTQDVDGDVSFVFTVADSLLSIYNCSLYLNGSLNKTNSNIGSTDEINATLGNGIWEWYVTCRDNAYNPNQSEIRTLLVAPDTDVPKLYIEGPDHDSTDTDGDLAFYFNVTDDLSGITNCTLIINGSLEYTKSPITESASQYFQVNDLAEGNWYWNITCTDDSTGFNSNTSDTRNFTVYLATDVFVNVLLNQLNYERGEIARITTNTTDELNNALDSTVYIDIIDTNTTLPWWETSWKKRMAIFLNDSGARTNVISFVNISGLAGNIQSCANEIRIISNSTNVNSNEALEVISGDDSNWCEVKFISNISSSAVNQNDYYAYYNNTGATNPDENVTDPINQLDYTSGTSVNKWAYEKTGESSNPPASGPTISGEAGFGSYTEIANSDSSWYPTLCGIRYQYATHNFKFEISSERANFNNFTILWTGYGNQAGSNLYIYNHSGAGSWLLVGTHATLGSDNTITGTYYKLNDFLDGSNYLYFVATAQRIHPSQQGYLYSNYANLIIEYDYTYVAGAKGEQNWIYRDSGSTGVDGELLSTWSTGIPLGWYSAASLASKDGYNNGTGSQNFEIIADTTVPKIFLNSPDTDSYSNTGTFIFNYTPEDNGHNWSNCSLFVNDAINWTNTSIYDNTSNTFSISSAGEGEYNWYVNCTDYWLNENKSEARTFTVDKTGPTVTPNSPVNSYNSSVQLVSLNFSVTDGYSNNLICNLTVNSQLNVSGITIANNTWKNITVSFPEGESHWNVTCKDNATNTNTGETRSVIIDLADPEVYLEAPSDITVTNNQTVTFSYNVTDSAPTKCELFTNATGAFTENQSMGAVNHSSNSFPQVTFESGSYKWNIYCNDTSFRNAGAESNYTFIIDSINPQIINASATTKNNSFLSQTWVFVNVTITETYESNVTFYLYDDGYSLVKNITYNPGNYSYNFTGLVSGSYYFNTTTRDQASNSNTTKLWKVTLDTAEPEVTLESPETNSWVNYTSLVFNFSATDDYLENCSFYNNLTGPFKKNGSITGVISGVTNSFTTTFSDGEWHWNVLCNDSARNVGEGVVNYTINIDTVEPQIDFASNNPVDNFNTSNNYITLNFSHTELNPKTISLTYTGSQVNKSYFDAWTNFSLTNLNDGTFSYYTWLNDSGRNTNITSTQTFTIDTTPPNISLNLPADDTWTNVANNNFTFSADDETLIVNSCSLIINGSINDTKTYTDWFNVTLTSSTYNWSVNCTDLVGNVNSSVDRIRKVDLTLPSIGSEEINDTKVNITQYICLNATVDDTYSGVEKVWALVTLPNSLTENVTLAGDTITECDASDSDNVYSVEYRISQVGIYNWTKTYANDTAGNVNSNEVTLWWNSTSIGTVTVNMTLPSEDLLINESETSKNFTYSQTCVAICDDKPQNCSNVTLYAKYDYGGLSSINTSSTYLQNYNDSYFCGNLTAGGASCSHTFTITSTTDSGDNKFEVWCEADSTDVGSYTSTERINLSINDHPNASFYYPTDSDWLHGNEWLNASSTTDDLGFGTYAFFLDNASTFVSSTELCNASSDECSFDSTSQGECEDESTDCYLKLIAVDIESLKNDTYIQIGIDNLQPRITLATPTDNDWSNSALVQFNFTPTDVNLNACKLYHNATGTFNENKTINPATSDQLNNISQSFDDGSYNWNIWCNDSETNSGFNETNRTIFIDTTYPEINFTFGTEENDTYINKDWIFLNVSVTEINEANITFYLYDNNSILLNETTKYDGSRTINFSMDKSKDRYYINTTIVDYAGNTNSTKTLFVKLDHIAPVATLHRPTNGSNVNGDYLVNATVTDVGLGIDTVYFAYRENATETWQLICTDTTHPYNCTWATTPLTEGNNYQVRAYGEDEAGNIGEEDVHINISIDHTAPEVNIESPEDNHRDLDGNMIFYYNVSDPISPITNCSILLNGTINDTTQSPNESITINFTLPSVGNGTWNWSIKCYNPQGLVNQTSGRNLSVFPDQDSPWIEYVLPDPYYVFTTTNLAFKYIVHDSLSEIKNCSLYINNTINKTQEFPTKDITQTFNVYNVADGNYSWKVECYDNSSEYNNYNITIQRNFSVYETTALNDQMVLNTLAPERGENLTVIINISDDLGQDIDAQVNISIINNSASIPWWNPYYQYRQALSVTNSWRDINANYTINFTIDTDALVSGGKALSNGNDFRVAYFNNVTNKWVELDRLVANFNTASTLVTIKTPNVLNDSIADVNYWIYYGYDSASAAPENESKVYLWYDDFSTNTLSNYNETKAFSDPDEDDSALSYNAGSDWVDYVATAGEGKSLRINDTVIQDLVIEADMYIDDWVSPLGTMELAGKMTGDTFYYFKYSTNILDSELYRVNGGSATSLNTSAKDSTKDVWHTLRLEIFDEAGQTNLRAYANTNLIMVANDTSPITGTGGFGFGGWQFMGSWDNLKVFGYTEGISVSELGTEETQLNWTTGQTGLDGGIIFTLSTWNLSVGNYTMISLVKNENYYNGYNVTEFDVTLDVTAPWINLTAPGNETWDNENVTLFFVPYDNSQHIKNCSLFIDGNFNQTKGSVTYKQTNNFSVTKWQGGKYNWSVNCSDYYNNSNMSKSFEINIDTSGPSINLITPANNYNTTNTSLNFTFIPTDNSGGNITCNVTINGAITEDNITVLHGNTGDSLGTSLTGGYNYWNITCEDRSGNVNTSITQNLTVIVVPETFMALIDSTGEKVMLNWSEVEGATNYSIFITEDYSNGFSETANATTTFLNWTDPTSENKSARYYKVNAARGDANVTTEITVGKMERYLHDGWNLVGTPLNLTHKTLGAFATSPNPFKIYQNQNIFLTIYRYAAFSDVYQKVDYDENGWTQATGSEDFTEATVDYGYWIETNETGVLMFVGEVITNNYTISLDDEWNVVDWGSIQEATLPAGSDPPSYPVNVSPKDAITQIYVYKNDSFELTNHFSEWGWYPAGNTVELTSLEPTYGYYMGLSEGATWNVDANK